MSICPKDNSQFPNPLKIQGATAFQLICFHVDISVVAFPILLKPTLFEIEYFA